MTYPVFISYARAGSTKHALALKERLGDRAFLDTEVIHDGDVFPERLMEGILGARVVVVFATGKYLTRRFCQLELRLALAAGDAGAGHIVIALGSGGEAVLNVTPPQVNQRSWPAAGQIERMAALVEKVLASHSKALGEGISATDARRLAVAFLEESKIPEAKPFGEIPRALPAGTGARSIGARFVGRGEDMTRLHAALKGNGKARVVSRIAGGAGFGKTRMAGEYLHRYGPQHYPGGLFWVNAAATSFEDELWRVLDKLEEKLAPLATMREQGREVGAELGRALRRIRKPALYVIDNIPEAGTLEDGTRESPRLIAEFCPAQEAVTILATSRQESGEDGVRKIEVRTLGDDAAVLLLTEGLAGAGALTWQEWARICEWVGGLPLALDLLNRCLLLGSPTSQELLAMVDAPTSRTQQLDRMREALRGQVPEGAVAGISEAFQLSFDRLQTASQRLALVLAQLASDPIPVELLDALPEELGQAASRIELRARHFVLGAGDGSYGVMHRLMADFLRTVEVREEAREANVGAGCAAVLKTMTPERCQDPKAWGLMRAVRPHAEFLIETVCSPESQVENFGALGLRAGLFASASGEYAAARRFFERVLEVGRRALGEDHPDTLTAMNNLAGTLWQQGDHAGARGLQERVLEMRRRVLGDEHAATLMAMNNLATTLLQQDDHARARRLQERVLEVMRRVLGEEHLDTLMAMNNLASTLWHQDDHAGARRLQERVLEVMRRVLGEEHLDTLMAMNNLASTLWHQDDHAGARKLYDRVLEVIRRVMGEEHPHTLMAMNNLAFTLCQQGDHTGARGLEERVLEVRRRVLGEEHPDTLTTMNNLAETLVDQGDHAGARGLQDRVLEVRRRVLGEEHPGTLTAINNLASTLWQQGDHAGARKLYDRVLEVIRRVMGEEHPATLTAMGNLVVTMAEMGELEEARRLGQDYLIGMRKVLGQDHPGTIACQQFLERIAG